ncbi:MAG: tryptophan synthase subunit alpha [Thermoplasmata archaeon]
MNAIDQKFAELRSSRSGALVPYVCAGDPDQAFTIELVDALAEAGADLVELGLPFSDPVADGPVIQGAMQRSLEGGFKVPHIFDVISTLRSRGLSVPIVLMTYYNPVLRFGVEDFCTALRDAGADGILVVDLPPEESDELDLAARSDGLRVIRLVAPSTAEARLDAILAKASGFVYAVSVSGTTGARETLPPSARTLLARVVPKTGLPVVLGFGISEPAHVRTALAMGASGVVVGSKLISAYAERLRERRDALEAARSFARGMKAATLGTLGVYG